MNSTKHLVFGILLVIFIISLGVAGYMMIEGWNLLDALYMTVTTLTTVGYGEVHEMTRMGQVFTILLIFIGVAFFVYVAGAVVQFIVEGRIRTILGRKRLDKKIEAGIERAKGLIAALATDTENVFLVLTARQLNPDLYIIARASSNESKNKLHAAGANKVELPYDMGAVSMAQRIIRPTVTNFLELAFAHRRKDIQMEEMPVHSSSDLINVMLKDSGIRQQFNLIIIAIKKPDGNMLFNPSFEAIIEAGDTMIAVGQEENLQKLEKILNPARQASG